ncbi:MAG: dephospho-CoA kinase [Ruminococcus sp.]|nr:dephospho-CoA kinase [Ruminococcus sp.]
MKNYCIVGLTGQSGAGKTTVSNCFLENGFFVVNCDIVSREVTEKGSKCNKKLSEHFPECFDSELTLDRKKLASCVFGNSEKLSLLNETIFPFIIDNINNKIDNAVLIGEKFILLDAPTLFEAKIENTCDYIVSVVANKNVRAERICKRDNLSENEVFKRFSSQNTEEFFREKSDFVIENDEGIESVVFQTISIINKIKELSDVPQTKE